MPDVEKNLRGVKEMNQLPGTPFPPADSKWGGSVESNIRAVVVAGDIIGDGCNTNPANTTVDPGCAAQLGNYTVMFPIELGVQRPTEVRFPTLEGAGTTMVATARMPLRPAAAHAHRAQSAARGATRRAAQIQAVAQWASLFVGVGGRTLCDARRVPGHRRRLRERQDPPWHGLRPGSHRTAGTARNTPRASSRRTSRRWIRARRWCSSCTMG